MYKNIHFYTYSFIHIYNLVCIIYSIVNNTMDSKMNNDNIIYEIGTFYN